MPLREKRYAIILSSVSALMWRPIGFFYWRINLNDMKKASCRIICLIWQKLNLKLIGSTLNSNIRDSLLFVLQGKPVESRHNCWRSPGFCRDISPDFLLSNVGRQNTKDLYCSLTLRSHSKEDDEVYRGKFLSHFYRFLVRTLVLIFWFLLAIKIPKTLAVIPKKTMRRAVANLYPFLLRLKRFSDGGGQLWGSCWDIGPDSQSF